MLDKLTSVPEQIGELDEAAKTGVGFTVIVTVFEILVELEAHAWLLVKIQLTTALFVKVDV